MIRGPYLLDVAAYRTIREWCRRSPGREVGGVLGGVGRYISHAVRVANVAERPATTYEWESCAGAFSVWDPTRHLCALRWIIQVESYWFGFLSCTGFSAF